MSLKTTPATYAAFSLTAIFLALFVVFCVLYYTEKNKKVDKVAIPVIPAWTKTSKTGNGATTLLTTDVLNAYVVRQTGNAGITATFPSAAIVVAAVVALDSRLVVNNQQFYMVFNNISSQVVTFAAGTGNTLSALTTLADVSYVIIRVTLTNVTSGSEAVTYTGVATGTN